MDDMSNPAAARQTLDERYGRSHRGRQPLTVVAVVALAAVLLGWLLWAAWVHSNGDVRAGLRTFDVVSEHQVKIEIEIDRSSGASVQCTLRAQSEDHAIVGEDVVTIPAGDAGSLRFTAALTTERRATAATVSGCH